MRKLSVALGALVFTLSAFGCSKAAPAADDSAGQDDSTGDDDDGGATSTSATTPAPGASSSTSSPTATATDANPVVTPGAPATPTDPAAPAPPATPGTPVTTPPVTTPPVTTPPVTTPPVVVTPAACSNGGFHETESNDTTATATAIGAATSFCGSIAAAGDVDNFSFTLPANARSFSWTGSFSVTGATVTMNAAGQTTSMNQAPPWAPGQLYVVTISGANALDYSINLNIGF